MARQHEMSILFVWPCQQVHNIEEHRSEPSYAKRMSLVAEIIFTQAPASARVYKIKILNKRILVIYFEK
jgi:hypothetical protein